MAAVEWIEGFQMTVGGEPHAGWLPPNVAIPLPSPVRSVELDLTIEADGDGFLLVFESCDGTVRGDTWHSTVADARDAAKRYFGVSTEAWSRT
jgi:hypothetical protein